MEEKVKYQTELSKKQGTGNLPIPVVGGSALLSQVFNEDCVTGMKLWPDKYFDLAVVDPPYGAAEHWKPSGNGGKRKYNISRWDIAPDDEYWKQLFRVSKNQIVWGGNYFTNFLPLSTRWICFQKKGPPNIPEFELAWTSLNVPNKIFAASRKDLNINWGKWIHPTQKPIQLYEWILLHYAKHGDLILDTHLGSGSSRIAAYKAGFQFVGYEIDKEYYEAQERRFKIFVSQGRLF